MNVLNYKLNAVMAKSRASYGKRLTGKDYESLLNCTCVAEITAYLRSFTVFGTALESFSASDISAGHLEFLLRKSQLEIFEKLYSYEIMFGQELYKYFVKSSEIDFILSKVRSIILRTPLKSSETIPGLYAGSFEFDMYALERVETVEELITVLGQTPYKDLVSSCYLKGSFDYLDYECSFSNYFNEYAYKLIKKCCGEKSSLMRLVTYKADTEFADKIYRTKKYFSLSSDRILRSIAPVHLTNFSQKQIQELIAASDEKEVLTILGKTQYKKYADEMKKADYAEQATARLNYEKYRHLVRFSTDPHEVMFCFMFLTENEVSNLIHIIEGVKYKMDAESIKKLLIGVGD